METLDWKTLVTVSVSTLIAVAGWLIGHLLTSRRDQRNKRRDLVIGILSDAFQTIPPYLVTGISPENVKPLQIAQIKMQLFGTPQMANLSKALNAQAVAEGKVNLASLLSELRGELRNELGLDPIDVEIHFLNVSATDDESAECRHNKSVNPSAGSGVL